MNTVASLQLFFTLATHTFKITKTWAFLFQYRNSKMQAYNFVWELRFFDLLLRRNERTRVSLVQNFLPIPTSFLKITNHVARDILARAATAFFEHRINFSVHAQDKKINKTYAIRRIPAFYSRTLLLLIPQRAELDPNLDKYPTLHPLTTCSEWQTKSSANYVGFSSNTPHQNNDTMLLIIRRNYIYILAALGGANFTFKMQSGRRGKFTAPFVVHMKIRECVSWGVGALGLMGPSAIENAGDASWYRCLFEHDASLRRWCLAACRSTHHCVRWMNFG